MTQQTDVKASEPLTSTATFKLSTGTTAIGRCRIKGVYAVGGASAGSVIISDGSGGSALLEVKTVASATTGSIYLLLPGEGILCASGPYGTIANTSSVVIFYA